LLDPALENVPLLLTAWHVLYMLDGSRFAEPAETTVMFEGMLDDKSAMPAARIERVLLESPVDGLDFVLALLDRFPGDVPRSLVAPHSPQPEEKVYIFGHPGGAGLAVTLEDNHVIAKRCW
jgi:hypothetical protein